MRDAERNCGTSEPFIPPYTLPNANRDTASKAFEGFGRTFEPFLSPYTPSNANRDFASKAFEVFGMAADAPKLADQGSVDQGSSLFDASHAFPRPKNRPIEAVVSAAVSVVVITSIGLMAVLLPPQNKSAATHGVSDAARLDAHRVGLGRGNWTNAENTIGTNDASPVDSIGADLMMVSAANPTEAQIRNPPMQRKPEDKLQSAIRELLIRSAYATSHRDRGIFDTVKRV